MSKFFSLEDEIPRSFTQDSRSFNNHSFRASTPLHFHKTDHDRKRHRSKSPRRPSKRSSRQYFTPTEDQSILGHLKCPACSSYFPDDNSSRYNHLSQHKDRFFTVPLPTSTCYINIQQALKHLLRLGIQKIELREKIAQCNLINWPSDLQGYSCSKCFKLDTINIKEFSRHMKEECNVRDKAERGKYLVSFCRRCHESFSSRTDLENHIEDEDDCWLGKELMRDCLEDSLKDDSITAKKQEIMKIKQERTELMESFEIKKEKIDEPRHVRFSAPPSPVFSDSGDYPVTSNPRPSSRPVSPVISPSPNKNVLPPPPQLSPVRRPARSPSRREMFAWSPPPPADSSLVENMNRSSSLVDAASRDLMADISRSRNVKIVSVENCQRGTCDWEDRHVDTCSKSVIMEKCSKGTCTVQDQHRTYPRCDKLSFSVVTSRDKTVPLPVTVPEGSIRDGQEPRHVDMRLLYSTTSNVLADPRAAALVYPHPVKPLPASCFRNQSWSVFTWSGLDSVRIKPGLNPHLIDEVADEIILL